MRLELELAAVPECVPGARAAITAFCEQREIEDSIVERVRVAVTEACTNCVQHAYPSDRGSSTFLLEASVDDGCLLVSISDYGVGIVGGRRSPNAGLGLGLGLIAELSDRARVSSRQGRGTRLALRFTTRSRALSPHRHS